MSTNTSLRLSTPHTDSASSRRGYANKPALDSGLMSLRLKVLIGIILAVFAGLHVAGGIIIWGHSDRAPVKAGVLMHMGD
jgi:hypothetical protein